MIGRELSTADSKLLLDVQDEMAWVWTEADYYGALALAFGRLVPGAEPGLMRWDGPHGAAVVLSNPADARMSLPFAATGAWRRSLPFDATGRVRDRFAHRVVSTEDLERFFPEGARAFREQLRPLGLKSVLRATLYDRHRFLAMAGYVGDRLFSERDRAVFQAIVPTLVQGVQLHQVVEDRHIAPGGIAAVVDALAQPAFVVSERGVIVYANPLAKRAFPRRPEWLKAVCRGGRAPKWVRRVPLAAERSKLSLILIDVLDVAPRDAASTPWARAWRLSPRLARVAALAMQGLSDDEIAAATKLSFASVRTYMRDVMQHAEVDNRVLLLRAALACGLKTRGT